MRHRLLAVSLASASIAFGPVIAAGAASAAPPPPPGQCPSGLTLAQVQTVQRAVEQGFEDAVKAADENGNNNGYVCYKVLPDQAPPTVLFGDDSAGFGSGSEAPAR
jgi:hypothetical protein